MLYEKNLTPSTDSYTYRKDIQDSDFVIMILDSRYGSEIKETGLSGTHEEWKILSSYNIPCHVYIKCDSKKESELELLITELNKEGISYFYYKTDKELLTRMNKTTFSIAYEIAYRNIALGKFGEKDSKKIIHQYEYSIALEFVKIIESAKAIDQMGYYNFIGSTLLTNALEYIDYRYSQNREIFYDQGINEKLMHLINEFNDFYHLHSKITTSIPGQYKEVPMKYIDGTLHVNRVQFHGSSEEMKLIEKKLKFVFKKYSEFKDYMTRRKIEIDLL